jgi:hypothetical protein
MSFVTEKTTMRKNLTFGNRRGGKRDRSSNNALGFSLLEAVTVISLILIVTGITFANYPKMAASIRVTNGFNTVLTTMRQTREKAISERRIYTVTFTAPRTMTVTQAATGTVINTISLPVDISFAIQAGFPSPGPDGFGTGVNHFDLDINVAGGNGNPIYFYPDGSGRDLNGTINNGVVYMCRPGEMTSSRAVSIWGTTGRLKGWRLSPGPVTGYIWGQQ